MAINTDKNMRITTTYPKEVVATLKRVAKENNRSFNNIVVHILKEYIKENGLAKEEDLTRYYDYGRKSNLN
jgi:hypothetical protein